MCRDLKYTVKGTVPLKINRTDIRETLNFNKREIKLKQYLSKSLTNTSRSSHLSLIYMSRGRAKIPTRYVFCKGYTLLEMLGVISLAAIFATLMARNVFTEVRRDNERNEVNNLFLGLRRAHINAMLNNNTVRVLFDQATSCFSIHEKKICFPQEVKVLVTAEKDANNHIAFFSFYPGGTSSGGHVRVEGIYQNCILNISWLTGETELASVLGKSHQNLAVEDLH